MLLAHGGNTLCEVVGEELDEGGLDRPAVDAGNGNVGAGFGDALPGAVEVLADRIRRVVRCQHQTDDGRDTVIGDATGGFFDFGVGMLEAERHLEPAWLGGVERGLQRCCLGFGELRERRDATDGGVTRDEISQRFRRRRATPSDVGVVRLDLFRGAWGAVGHQDNSDSIGCHQFVVPSVTWVCSWTRSTTAWSTAGSVSGWTPWPRLKMWPGCCEPSGSSLSRNT